MTNRWAALAVLFLARTSFGFQYQALAAVGPFVAADLGLSRAQLGWLVGLYLLPGAIIAFGSGMLGARIGERRSVLAGLALMAAGGMVTAAAGSFAPAAAGRVLAGIGGIVVNVLLAKMVADWFAGREIATAMGITLTAWPVGLGLAVATLGAVAARGSWAVALQLTAGAAGVAFLLVAGLPRPPARAGASPPPAGRGRVSRRELALALSSGAAWGFLNAGLLAFAGFLPGYLTTRGLPIAAAGALASLGVWVTTISVPAGGYLADRLGRPDWLIVAGSLATAACMAAVPWLPGPAVWLVLFGLCLGPPCGPIMALLPGALAPDRLAPAFGFFYSLNYLAMAMAQPVAGLLLDWTGRPETPVLAAAAMMGGAAVAVRAFRHLATGRPPGVVPAPA